jgi:hypothetical protein
MAESVEEIRPEVNVLMGFRDEQRIVGAGVGSDDLAEERRILGIEIRGKNVDGRGGRLPDGNVGLLRPTGGILLTRRWAVAILECMNRIGDPHVAVHRQRILGLARSRDLSDVVGGVVGSKALIGVGAEGMRPRTGAKVK